MSVLKFIKYIIEYFKTVFAAGLAPQAVNINQINQLNQMAALQAQAAQPRPAAASIDPRLQVTTSVYFEKWLFPVKKRNSTKMSTVENLLLVT